MKDVLQKNTEQSRKGDYKMKKFFALVCMITCIFGLTACGSEEAALSSYEQQKLDYAQQLASQQIVPLLANFMDDANVNAFSQNTLEEIEYLVSNQYNLSVDGYAFSTAITSFNSAADSIGTMTGVGETTGEISDDEIIVHVEVFGDKKNAEAEVILSNDMFMELKSAALNPVSSMGDLMGRAALNTLIGMGTVFVVLILISLIISCFSFIPKIQEKLTKKKKDESKTTGIDNAVTQITLQEESVEESDDMELVAVIAAAIAASEGAASTDGFVVRSIRKVRR